MLTKSLPDNSVFLFDLQDVVIANLSSWYKNSSGYVAGNKTIAGKQRTVLFHREIMRCPEGLVIDHIDGDKLNNTRNNLRICTHQDNLRNRPKTLYPTSSRYKGVSFDTACNRWAAAISIDNKSRRLGLYYKEVDAARAYDRAAVKYFGPFANLNNYD